MNCQNPTCNHPKRAHKIGCGCTDPKCPRHGACAECGCERFYTYGEEVKEDVYIPESLTADCPICTTYGYAGCAICREIESVIPKTETPPEWEWFETTIS